MSYREETGRVCVYVCVVFFFQAEDGIRDLVRSRGLGDVYKRQQQIGLPDQAEDSQILHTSHALHHRFDLDRLRFHGCLLYTSDAADERSSVDLGGRRIIKKKTIENPQRRGIPNNTMHTHQARASRIAISGITK